MIFVSLFESKVTIEGMMQRTVKKKSKLGFLEQDTNAVVQNKGLLSYSFIETHFAPPMNDGMLHSIKKTFQSIFHKWVHFFEI